ncbi:MAG: flagellar protein FlaG [Mariprofundaceae bacterium]
MALTIAHVAQSTSPASSSPSVDVRSSSAAPASAPVVQPTEVKAPPSNEVSLKVRQDAEKKQPTEQEVQQAVAEASREFSGPNEKIAFGYEKRLNMLIVQVQDRETGEVIREIPPREFIDFRIAMRERIGLLLDKQG